MEFAHKAEGYFPEKSRSAHFVLTARHFDLAEPLQNPEIIPDQLDFLPRLHKVAQTSREVARQMAHTISRVAPFSLIYDFRFVGEPLGAFGRPK